MPQISPNGSRVIYMADQDTNNVFELFSVPIEGGQPIKLNPPLAPDGDVSSLPYIGISPDNSLAIYTADQESDEVFELYSVPIEGGPVVKLNAPLVPGGAVSHYQISSDSSRVVYAADQETDGVFELYSASLVTGLRVDKMVNIESAQPKDTLTYSLHISALGEVASVALTDTLPTGVLFEKISDIGATYDPAAHQLLYSGTVEPSAPLVITYTAQVEEDVAPGSLIYSEVVVSALNQEYADGAGFTVARPDTVPTLNLIYANGDNDLADEVRELFQKAETAAANPSMTTLLLFDGDEIGDNYLYRLQPSDDQAETCPSLLNPTCDGRYEEGVNMWSWSGGEAVSSYSSLVEFLSLAMNAYPSEQVTLSLVGHGGGWSPDLLPGQPRFHSGKPSNDPLGGLLWDLNPTSSFSTAQLGEALREATARTGRKIDLLYLDACLMAMSEVAYEVHDSANYLLASENWSWTSFRYNEHLSLDGNLSAEELGKQWLKHEADYLSERDYPITYSLLDLNAMDEQLAHENSLAEALKASLPEGKEKIRSAFMGSSCFDGDQDYELLPTDADDYYCDLGSFAQQLEREFGSEHPVAQAAQALQAHIDQQLVVQEIHHNGRPWEHPEFLWAWTELSGVSKYMPLGEDDWKRAYYAPTHLQSTADGRWDEFLAAYWNSATSPAPPPACEGNCEPKGPETLNEELEPMGNRTFLPVVLQ